MNDPVKLGLAERIVIAVERHPARALTFGSVAALVTLCSVFIAGFSCHKDFLETSGFDSVRRGSYVLRADIQGYASPDDLRKAYVSREEVSALYVLRSNINSEYVRRSDCPPPASSDSEEVSTGHTTAKSSKTISNSPTNDPKVLTLTCGGEGYDILPDYVVYTIIVPPNNCWTKWQRTPPNFWWGSATVDGQLEQEIVVTMGGSVKRTLTSSLGSEIAIGYANRFRNSGSRPVAIKVVGRYR